MDRPYLWNTLDEAAAWLSSKTKYTINTKQILDTELSHISARKHSIRAKALQSRLRVSFPKDTEFSVYKFEVGEGFVFKRYATWQTVPLYLVHIGELYMHGETRVAIAQYESDDMAGEGETIFIEPPLHGQIATLPMVGIQREDLERMVNDFLDSQPLKPNLTPAQQDKLDCQSLAKKLWESDQALTQAAVMKTNEIQPYVKKYKGKNTIPQWLAEVDPRPKNVRRGRPKKHTSES